jgi:hypothetical protein
MYADIADDADDDADDAVVKHSVIALQLQDSFAIALSVAIASATTPLSCMHPAGFCKCVLFVSCCLL